MQEFAFESLVDMTKLRWRIERDYQDLKQEVGLGDFEEGRGWRGFHHHLTLCVAAYGFLVSEKDTISPSGHGRGRPYAKPALPEGFRPRGTPAPDRTALPQLDCDHASAARSRDRRRARPMSMLRNAEGTTPTTSQPMTQ